MVLVVKMKANMIMMEKYIILQETPPIIGSNLEVFIGESSKSMEMVRSE